MSERRDPFDDLARPVEPQAPRPRFARDLRARLVTELGLDPDPTSVPTVDLPGRAPMAASSPSASPIPSAAASDRPGASGRPGPARAVVTPYLSVDRGVEALAWYTEAFGAEEAFRVVGDDGRLGHAELSVAGARLMLSDAYPEIGVHSPAGLGGTAVAIHLEVPDVDALFARAVAAGATSLGDPADQPHGARHGTLLDPFGHRWMLSQAVEDLSLDEYAERAEGSGFRVQHGPRAGEPYVDGLWSVVAYRDPEAGIRFLTEVLGFEEQTMARDDTGRIVHSEYRWPEGGVVQVAGVDEANPFVPAAGGAGPYVVTRDPLAVWERCQAAGVEVIRALEEPHYDPGGLVFAIRDPEGTSWSFGTYAGGA